jgi:hypothetical protein
MRPGSLVHRFLLDISKNEVIIMKYVFYKKKHDARSL